MLIQKIWNNTSRMVTEYEITTEMMQSLPHTFGNFTDVEDFHSAFFDSENEKHQEAYEILEHVLKPNTIYPGEDMGSTEHWASGDDIVAIGSVPRVLYLKETPEGTKRYESDIKDDWDN